MNKAVIKTGWKYDVKVILGVNNTVNLLLIHTLILLKRNHIIINDKSNLALTLDYAHSSLDYSSLTFCELTHRGMLGYDEERERGKEKNGRGRVGIGSLDRAPVCQDEQMVDLAGTGTAWAHPQEGTNTTTSIFFLLLPLTPLKPSLSLPLSLLTQHIQSSALISTTCPHLPASRGRNNMACNVWPCSTGWMKCTVKETGFSSCHCWTCNLMCRRSAAEFVAAKHNGLITLNSEANCRTESMALEVCHWVSFKCVSQRCSYHSSRLLFVHSEWRLL